MAPFIEVSGTAAVLLATAALVSAACAGAAKVITAVREPVLRRPPRRGGDRDG